MKPYTHQLYNPIAVPYTVGVTRKNNVFDQKTSAFHLKPGHHIAINVFPKLVSSSNEFNGLDLGQSYEPYVHWCVQISIAR